MYLKSSFPLGNFHLNKIGSEVLDYILHISLLGEEVNTGYTSLLASCGTLVRYLMPLKLNFLICKMGVL